MSLVERNHVVQQVSPTTSHPALCDSMLPRASERSSDRFKSDGIHRIANRFAELGIAIQDQVFMLRVIGKGFAQLLRDPETSRMPSDVAVQDAPAVVGNHEEAVQKSKGERWDSEEVHC